MPAAYQEMMDSVQPAKRVAHHGGGSAQDLRLFFTVTATVYHSTAHFSTDNISQFSRHSRCDPYSIYASPVTEYPTRKQVLRAFRCRCGPEATAAEKCSPEEQAHPYDLPLQNGGNIKMFILQIGAHQKRQNILKLHLFYAIISSCDELTFQMLRKGGRGREKTAADPDVRLTDDPFPKAIRRFKAAAAETQIGAEHAP